MGVQIINNILSEEVFNQIENNNSEVFFNNKLKTSIGFWKHDIVEYSKEVLIYHLNENSSEYKAIKSEIEKHNKEYRILSIMYYYWQPGSYIPWHGDGKYSSAMTIYLNNEWNYEWGGLFQYHDGNNVKSITPQKNMGVYQEQTLPHSTTIMKENSPIRRTIQIFFNNEKVKPTTIL